ncbi:MFS transporter [Streptomyces sp. R39]|uniref:MFS transporter n=1 Tax=Streptomyces sp. R39 TaxID=3238631 RepID=A0AB39QIQ4_9ACTN
MPTDRTRRPIRLGAVRSDVKTEPRRHTPALTLTAALLGFALITLDASVVNVALPAIGSALGGGLSGLQWTVDAYTLTFAALMLSTGAFADRAGASRAYGLGIAVFTLASAACGLAPTLTVLISARVAQGAAAAVVLPASLSLVRHAYADPAQRTRAVALWGAGGSVALALGCALTVPPLTVVMMEAVPAERAGLAAGVLNAARQVAGGLGIAVFGALVGGGFVAGMRAGLTLAAALFTVAFVLSFRRAGRPASRA